MIKLNTKVLRSVFVIFAVMLVSADIQAGNGTKLTDTETGEQSKMDFTDTTIGPGGILMLAGKGDSLLPNKMLLTSNAIISINNNDIQVGDGSFQITKDTKICGNTGKRSKLDTFKTGDGVTIISFRKEKEALTLKMGLALYRVSQYGASPDQTSYECK